MLLKGQIIANDFDEADVPSQFQERRSAPSDERSEADWLAARRIADQLDRILETSGSREPAIARAAAELRLTTRQIYNLLARYRTDRTVTALLPRTSGPRRKRLTPEVEAIIAGTLEEQWLTLEAPPLAPVVAEIRARCEEAGMARPSYVTVARRIPALFSAETIARKRSANPKHLMRLRPRPGYIHAAHPLDVCQIDHTPTDVNFVEIVDGAGVFVGRPYLTLVTDVATRAILGFCLLLEKPSVLSVALCLAQALCPKDDWLASRDIRHAWPMYGRPRLLVTDSAMEFKGNAFQRGCDEFGIRIRYRDRGRVHHGGVVERLLGKLNGLLATLPGTTKQSVAARDQYPAQQRARLSFPELERCVVLAIIDHNRQQNSKTLKVPAGEWEQRAPGRPVVVDDPHHVLLTFLQAGQRRLSPQGISMFALHYYSSWLGRLVPERDRLGKLEVRFDPRDISRIFVRDPQTDAFMAVERRDGVLAHITIWEHQAERARLRASSHRTSVDIVSLRREITNIADAATLSKRRLRNAVRRAHAANVEKRVAETMEADLPPAIPRERPKARLPVEDW